MLLDIVAKKRSFLQAIGCVGLALLLAGCPCSSLPEPTDERYEVKAIRGNPDGTTQAYVSYSYFQPGGESGCGDIKHYQSFSNTKSSKLTLSLTGSVVNMEPGIEAPPPGGSMVGVRTGSDPVSILLSDGSKLGWSPSNQKLLTRTSAAGTVLWGVSFPALLDISAADSLPDGSVRIGGPIAANSQVSEAAIIGLDGAGQPVWQVNVHAVLSQ